MRSEFFYTLILGLVMIFFSSTSATAQIANEQTITAAPAQKLQTIKIKVSGVTCSGDCKDIEKSVRKTNGVASAKLVGKPSSTSAFEISFDPAVITEKEIRKIVESTPGCENPDDRPYKVKKG